MSKNEIPAIVLALANSRKPKKPSGSRVKLYNDPLAEQEIAIAFIKSLGDPLNVGLQDVSVSIDDKFVPEIHQLRESIEHIVEVLATQNQTINNFIDISVPLSTDLDTLNRLSSKCQWIKTLRPDMVITETLLNRDIIGLLATTCINELSNCDPTRIKTCERPECGHFFYDTTRNRSAKWHAEDPCGWRARSDRRQLTSKS